MKLGLNIYSLLSCFMVIISFLLFLNSLFFSLSDQVFFGEWMFLKSLGLDFCMGVLIDWMSLSFLGTVSLISGSILYYCNYYMHGEKDYLRFTFIMLSFVGSMWFLIISPNLVSILLGWDGLGLTSYALVIFYQNEMSANAGMLTVLSNRIGDVAILMGICLMSFNGSFNFIFMERCELFMGFMIILAAMTKSAQMPFSAWLPAAMAAPTPVSSLVHSSTLVTAGVYLIIRFSPIIMSSLLFNFIFFTGIVTMFMSGLGANFESDLKKVVALSTLSQLGLMFTILGFGQQSLAFFHLITHALFKSSMFMCVGFMIHSSEGVQDSRYMSSFFKSSPFLGLGLSITNLALMGFPFLAGFYSKDVMLEMISSGLLNKISFIFIVMSTVLTVCYSIRLMMKGLSSVSNLNVVSGLGDFDIVVMKSIFFLLGMSGLGGFLVGSAYYSYLEVEVLSNFAKFWVIFCLLFASLLLVNYLSFSLNKSISKGVKIYNYLSQMWFLSKLSSNTFSNIFLSQGMNNIKVGESGWFEQYGGQGGKLLFMYWSVLLQKGQKSVMISSYLISGFVILCLFII